MVKRFDKAATVVKESLMYVGSSLLLKFIPIPVEVDQIIIKKLELRKSKCYEWKAL